MLIFSCFLPCSQCQNPTYGMVAVTLRVGFPPQLKLPSNALTDTPLVCFLGAVSSTRVDDEKELPQVPFAQHCDQHLLLFAFLERAILME